MRKFVLLSTVFLASCLGATDSGVRGVEISEARFHPPLPGQSTGVGFLKLDNKGAQDRLLGVYSPVSERTELHNHVSDNGVMRMRKVNAIDLPAGQLVELESGSFHIMLFNAEMVLGEETTLRLDFENGPDVTINVPIIHRGATPTHSEHGSHSKGSEHGSDTKH